MFRGGCPSRSLIGGASRSTEDTSDDYVSTFSSRVPTLIDHFLKPDLVAPGNRLASVNARNSRLKKGLPERQRGTGEYLELSGTSMAAAMVSGAATLPLSAEPGLGPESVKTRLMTSARKVPGADPTGWGASVLDVTAALAATGSVTAAPSPQMTRLETGANFDTVYHINGQQTVELRGDTATGVAYCLVVLVGTENGKRLKQTNGVHYNDEYVRRGDTWLISKRTSSFIWRNAEEVAPASR